jgi:hypothetical protein
MKFIQLIILSTLITPSAYASDELKSNVLAESKVVVGFAPPENRGTFRTQILTNGRVQSIDNKGKITRLASLSKGSLKKLKDSIKTVGDFRVIEPNGPICMDAPSQYVTLKIDKKDVQVWAKISCREHYTDNGKANQIADSINALRKSFSILTYIE